MKWIHLCLLALAFWFFPGQATAQVDTKLGQMFGTMANVTDPSDHMGAKRGIVSGGGIEIRNQPMNFSVWNFQAPRFEMGCNGISAFFGSFTFISKDQLQQAMRAIATAAVVYAFKIALAAMCPMCEKVLSELQAKMDEWNRGNINACEFAQSIMDESGLSDRIDSSATSMSYAAGWRKDNESAKERGQPYKAGVKLAERLTAEQKKDFLFGNHAWIALTDRGGAMAWLVGANTALMEDIMSYTGTVVVCSPDVEAGCLGGRAGKDPNGQTAVNDDDKAPTIPDIKQIIEGPSEGNDYIRLKCNETTNCLTVTATKIANFKGTVGLLEEVFIGGGGNPGLIARISGNLPADPGDDGWIGNTGIYGKTILELAKRDAITARKFFNDNKKSMAASIVVNLMYQHLGAMSQGLDQRMSGGREIMRAKITNAYERLKTQEMAYEAVAPKNAALVDYYIKLRSLQKRQPVGALN